MIGFLVGFIFIILFSSTVIAPELEQLQNTTIEAQKKLKEHLKEDEEREKRWRDFMKEKSRLFNLSDKCKNEFIDRLFSDNKDIVEYSKCMLKVNEEIDKFREKYNG